MSLFCEFNNLIILRKSIERVYEGGFNQLLKDKSEFLGKVYWYDNHLFRDGSMNSDIEYKIEKYESLGLIGRRTENGITKWIDFCQFPSLTNKVPSCDWIEVGRDNVFCYLKGTEFDDLVGPEKQTSYLKLKESMVKRYREERIQRESINNLKLD